jgi:hypothetical protein
LRTLSLSSIHVSTSPRGLSCGSRITDTAAGASPTTEEPLTVLQQRSTMTCEEVELNSVRAFSRNWLEPILG